MSSLKSLFIAVPVAFSLLAAPAAFAEDHGDHGRGPARHGDWHGDRGHGGGNGVAGAILGLGAAAVIGGVIASQAYAPPVVYAPPPAYYAPPPVVYAPPPPPGYYQPNY